MPFPYYERKCFRKLIFFLFRSAPTTAQAQPNTNGDDKGDENNPDKKSGKIKSRIESWLKDAETDAEKAEEYLGRKKEKLKEVESKRCNFFLTLFFQTYIKWKWKKDMLECCRLVYT